MHPSTIAPGVHRIRLGTPEAYTPSDVRIAPPMTEAMAKLPEGNDCPIDVGSLRHTIGPRGVRIEIPLTAADEQFYGAGLQLFRLNQTGRKLTLRVNSDPIGGAGDSHAPVPFIVSTAGYGIWIDTARYVSFYLGSHERLETEASDEQRDIATSTETLYAGRQLTGRVMIIDIPVAQGVDVYVFSGPSVRNVVQRYNLYSGGGCLPAIWGLGMWYRCFGQFNQQQALDLAKSFREAKLPCDVLGLEPGWQTKAYSCSYVWSDERFPDPDALIQQTAEIGFNLNLWTHVYVHPSSPVYEPLKPHSGDYKVWGGLVPDLSIPAADDAFASYHQETFVEHGITGFKLDECDGSDFIPHSSWAFPEASSFPSGLDGEQLHTLIGMLYQRSIYRGFDATNTRTYSEVRSSGALAAPLPFVLYSDLYDHREFVRGVATSSFSGLLWSPEVRDAHSPEELLRRIQAVVLSPQALINAWYIKNPPWLQFDRAKNNAGDLLPEAKELEAAVRKLFRLRMSLLPYIYAAFAKYHFEGLPPFRAMAMDYPTEPAASKLDDQFLIGDDLIAAPIFTGQTSRDVWLPPGVWYGLFDHQRYEGGQSINFPVTRDTVLVFVRSGTILPWAEPVEYVGRDTVFDITPLAFGESLRAANLFEDDGVTYDWRNGSYNWVTIDSDGKVSRTGKFGRQRYRIAGMCHIV